ncbi:MAG: leucine-rich repeat protein, partial [Clostridia bacterium]|nr:leucine-rich repeat protein [Clostridia bacterium]
CGLAQAPAHVHSAACYNQAGELTCVFRSVHTHTADCYVTENGKRLTVCGHWYVPEIVCTAANWTLEKYTEEGHVHTAECYAVSGEPVCGLVEHTHSADCYTRPLLMAAAPLRAEAATAAPTQAPAAASAKGKNAKGEYVFQGVGDTVELKDLLKEAGVKSLNKYSQVTVNTDLVKLTERADYLQGNRLKNYTVTALGYFDEAALALTSTEGVLRVVLRNPAPPTAAPTQEPTLPPTEEPTAAPTETPAPTPAESVSYTFTGIGDYTLALNLLSAHGIEAASLSDAWMGEGQEDWVSLDWLIGDIQLVAEEYFDAALLTVKDSADHTYEITLHNPEPQEEPVTYEYDYTAAAKSTRLNDIFAALGLSRQEQDVLIGAADGLVQVNEAKGAWTVEITGPGKVTLTLNDFLTTIILNLNIQTTAYGIPTGKTGIAGDRALWTEYLTGGTYTLVYTLTAPAAGKTAAITRSINDKEAANRANVIVLENGITGIGWADSITDKGTADIFKGLPALTRVVPCASLEQIGNSAFKNCEALADFDFSACPSLSLIHQQAFKGCSALQSADLSACGRLTALGDEAFTTLTSVSLPASITELNLDALGGKQLSEIHWATQSEFTILRKGSSALEADEALFQVTETNGAWTVSALGSGVIRLTLSNNQTVTLYITAPDLSQPAALHLEAQVDGASISLEIGEDAGLPAATQLAAGNGLSGEVTAEKLLNLALQKLNEGREKPLTESDLRLLGVYDLALSVGGEARQPAAPVTVTVQPAAEIPEKSQVYALHLLPDDSADLIPATRSDTSISFPAEGFSVYALIGVITQDFLSANGVLYEVTVTYGEDAQIPEGAKLQITEFEEGSDEYTAARKAVLADKVAKNEQIDLYTFGFAALDISIVVEDEAGNLNEIEPAAPVQVSMKIKSLPGVADLSEIADTLAIQHHVEVENGVVVETVYSGQPDASFTMETDEAIAAVGTVVDPASVNEEDFVVPVVSAPNTSGGQED